MRYLWFFAVTGSSLQIPGSVLLVHREQGVPTLAASHRTLRSWHEAQALDLRPICGESWSMKMWLRVSESPKVVAVSQPRATMMEKERARDHEGLEEISTG
jgi:hypothetical protein